MEMVRLSLLLICLFLFNEITKAQSPSKFDSLNKYLISKVWIVAQVDENDSVYYGEATSYYYLIGEKSVTGDTAWFNLKNIVYDTDPVTRKKKLSIVSCNAYFYVYGIKEKSFNTIYSSESWGIQPMKFVIKDNQYFYLETPGKVPDWGRRIIYEAVDAPDEVKQTIKRLTRR